MNLPQQVLEKKPQSIETSLLEEICNLRQDQRSQDKIIISFNKLVNQCPSRYLGLLGNLFYNFCKY